MSGQVAAARNRLRSWFRRGPWENGASAVIGLGIIMLVQPLSIDLFSYSFVTILAGTLGFVVFSHFPK
jgi:hypothetical protein